MKRWGSVFAWLGLMGLLWAPAWGQVSYGPPNPESTIELVEEFIGGGNAANTGYGTLGWRVNTAANVTAITSEAGRPGLRRVDTTATINTVTALVLGLAASVFDLLPAELFDVTWIVRPNQTTQQELRVGLNGSITGSPATDGIYFEHDTNSATSTTNWVCVTRAASTSTATNSTVAVTAAQWFKLRIVRADATTIQFWIDGILRCTHTTNIPTAGVYVAAWIENLEAASKTVDLDFMRLRVRGLVR